MSAIEIRKVESRSDLRTFIEFHYDLYEGNEYDAPNLYTDEVNTLRKDKNAAFDFCEAEYFIAYKDGKVVGRVAAIINNSANEKWQRKAVRFGWIDFIDDIEVSRALFNAVEDYGRSKGMTEIIGPLGFTDMDPEGMLTAGFGMPTRWPPIRRLPTHKPWTLRRNSSRRLRCLRRLMNSLMISYSTLQPIVSYNFHVCISLSLCIAMRRW